MVATVPVDALFEGSDGRYYTEWQRRRRVRAGDWRRCLYETKSGLRLVETGDGSLLSLSPIDVDDLPSWTEIRIRRGRRRVVDTRRPLPD